MNDTTPHIAMGKQGNRGFTLIELMIVVVIVGILAAVAYPSYRNQVIKGNRSAAKSYLMALAAREEQYMLDARSYAGTVALLNLGVPTEVSPFYAVTINAPGGTPPTFAITATPIAGTMQAGDGNLVLNSDGSKTGKW